ncbi:hypothetical protein VNI00_015847 [Paramarasmius palmivorus]|uniref:Uncharacterized protein n=1 Tax=Paramarasmius palmivorus TaxID=297713 RepID=A0AAW0BIG5_9AGAR
MSKRSRQKQRAPTQYSAGDFSSSSDSNDELQQAPSKRSKGQAFVSSLSRDQRRILTKPISMGEPTPMKQGSQLITQGLASMAVAKATDASMAGGKEDSSDSSGEGSNSGGKDSDSSGEDSDSEAGRHSSNESSEASQEPDDLPWAGISEAQAEYVPIAVKQRKELYLEEWLGEEVAAATVLVTAAIRMAMSRNSDAGTAFPGSLKRA